MAEARKSYCIAEAVIIGWLNKTGFLSVLLILPGTHRLIELGARLT